jgi:hypothetical protein
MNPTEPLPPATPKSGIGMGMTILLWLVAPVILVVSLWFLAGFMAIILMIWSAITCPHCPLMGM